MKAKDYLDDKREAKGKQSDNARGLENSLMSMGFGPLQAKLLRRECDAMANAGKTPREIEDFVRVSHKALRSGSPFPDITQAEPCE